MAQRWLFKEEPSNYSYQDLAREGRTVWSGVRNNLALKHLRQARPGDEFLYYHTGKEKAVVGVGRVISEPYPDPNGDQDRFVVVDVEPVEPLARPVTLAELRAEPSFTDSPLVRISRLSVMPISASQWRAVIKLAER